jgi:hypothetical protein
VRGFVVPDDAANEFRLATKAYEKVLVDEEDINMHLERLYIISSELERHEKAWDLSTEARYNKVNDGR